MICQHLACGQFQVCHLKFPRQVLFPDESGRKKLESFLDFRVIGKRLST